MTLFCVKDGPGGLEDLAKGWNQPLKKVETPVPAPTQQYEQTSTPGVVIDKLTGKMETQLPLPLTNKFSGRRAGFVILDDLTADSLVGMRPEIVRVPAPSTWEELTEAYFKLVK